MQPPVDNLSRERDSCGIGFLADATGRASRTIVDGALEGLSRMRHRGAIAADGHTGDGAGVLMPLPRAPLAGPVVRARDGLPPRRARPRSRRSGMRGGRHRPRGLAHGADRAAGSRRRGTPLDAADRTARAAPAARAVARRGRGLRLPRSSPRGRDARRLRGVAVIPDRHLQGALRRRPARCVLRRPPRPGARRAVRDLPPALLDEYIAVVGARPALPPPLPQRRDQLDRRQRGLDARSRAPPRGGRLRLDAARQRARAARARGPGRPACDGDADPGSG